MLRKKKKKKKENRGEINPDEKARKIKEEIEEKNRKNSCHIQHQK